MKKRLLLFLIVTVFLNIKTYAIKGETLMKEECVVLLPDTPFQNSIEHKEPLKNKVVVAEDEPLKKKKNSKLLVVLMMVFIAIIAATSKQN